MSIYEETHRIDEGTMQCRGSTDGIIWGDWIPLVHLGGPAPGGPWFAMQGRVWADGAWRTSPVATYDD